MALAASEPEARGTFVNAGPERGLVARQQSSSIGPSSGAPTRPASSGRLKAAECVFGLARHPTRRGEEGQRVANDQRHGLLRHLGIQARLTDPVTGEKLVVGFRSGGVL